MGKTEFESGEGHIEVVTNFPSDLLEECRRDAGQLRVPLVEIFKTDISLLKSYCDIVSQGSTDDPYERRLVDMVEEIKPLVDIEFHEYKNAASIAKRHERFSRRKAVSGARTTRVRINVPDTIGVNFDATALGLGVGQTGDFITYAAFFGRHLTRGITNPPPEE